MQEYPTLAAALVAAQTAATGVEKDSKNSYHNYKYASAEAIMAEAREALNSAGLATLMERWELLPPTHDGAPERVKVHFLTLHANSDQTLKGDTEYFVMPEKGRPEDKATATALTYAEGYYLRGLLCLPRVEEGSQVDDRDDREKLPGPKRPPQNTKSASNGNGKQKSDSPAIACEEYKAKIPGMTGKSLLAAIARFKEAPDAAAERFGKDGAELLLAATVAQLYKSVDISIGGLPTDAEVEKFRKEFEEGAAKYLSEMQVDTLNAQLDRRLSHIKEDLEKAQKQTR